MKDALRWDLVGAGSDAELLPDETVCAVSNLTYFKALSRSPHLDDRGLLQ